MDDVADGNDNGENPSDDDLFGDNDAMDIQFTHNFDSSGWVMCLSMMFII